jgi:hypothetical protein
MITPEFIKGVSELCAKIKSIRIDERSRKNGSGASRPVVTGGTISWANGPSTLSRSEIEILNLVDGIVVEPPAILIQAFSTILEDQPRWPARGFSVSLHFKRLGKDERSRIRAGLMEGINNSGLEVASHGCRMKDGAETILTFRFAEPTLRQVRRNPELGFFFGD